MKHIILFLLLITMTMANAASRQVRVFVALCDNKTQGIQPVGAKIGDGDVPDDNLYWGCTDGFGSYFTHGGNWKVVKSERDLSHQIMRKLTLKHAKEDLEITAFAYRGSEIRRCIEDFQAAAADGKSDLVAYIGHNGLMDFELKAPVGAKDNKTAVMVLCCMSESYFGQRLRDAGCRPMLMTRQLMYPGSFILSAALEAWIHDKKREDIRAAAGQVYAKNQKISVQTATGVFAMAKEIAGEKMTCPLADSAYAGCCWEMQWRVPPSSTRSRQSMALISRSGNISRMMPSARSSFLFWRNVGTNTQPLMMRKFT